MLRIECYTISRLKDKPYVFRATNRLDKDTSGLVIFAKHEYIQECLVKQMKLNLFKKEYLAILTGRLNNKNGKIDASIARKNGSIIEREINPEGERAITYFNVENEFLYNNQKLSLVKYCGHITPRLPKRKFNLCQDFCTSYPQVFI